jgi:hypothetical protein
MLNYNLYIDEPGTANINEYRDTFFVISGIILESQFDHDVTSYFTFLKRRYGLQEQVNFHAAEFFENKNNKLFNTISDDTAKEFCYSLGEFLKTIPLNIVSHAIDKNLLRAVLKMPENLPHGTKKLTLEDRDIGYQIIVRKLLFEFTSHLIKQESFGSVIAESRRESDKVFLQAFLESQESFRFREKPYYYSISDEARKRISSVRFENKRGLTGGLEIADICSYVVYRHLHNSLHTSLDRGALELWKVISGRIEKPIHSNNGLLLSKKDMSRVASDRVYKVSDRILAQIRSGTL